MPLQYVEQSLSTLNPPYSTGSIGKSRAWTLINSTNMAQGNTHPENEDSGLGGPAAKGYAKAVSLFKQGECLNLIGKPGALQAYMERSL